MVYILNSSITGTYNDKVTVSEAKTKFISRINGKYYGSPSDYNPYFKVKDDNKNISYNDNTVSFSVNYEFSDIAESKLTSLSVKFVKSSSQNWSWTK